MGTVHLPGNSSRASAATDALSSSKCPISSAAAFKEVVDKFTCLTISFPRLKHLSSRIRHDHYCECRRIRGLSNEIRSWGKPTFIPGFPHPVNDLYRGHF